MTRTRVLIFLDSTLFVAAITVWSVPLTGLAAHEWLGLAVAGLIVAHIVLQGNWLAFAARRLRTHGAWRMRVNFLLNVMLFVAATLAVYSGIMISQVALPAVGLAATTNPVWNKIHGLSQHLMTIFVGLHIAINWRWIITIALRWRLSKPATSRGDVNISSKPLSTAPKVNA